MNDFTDAGVIATLLSESLKLSQELPIVRTYTAKELVREYESKIERKRLEIKQASHAISRKIDDLRELKRNLELADDRLKTDKRETENLFWDLHNAEKDSKYRSPLGQ